MQNTRLNRVVDVFLTRSLGWLRNPWRRISLVVIGLLFGNFLASAVATISGQAAEWDVTAAAVLTGVTEIMSWLVYRLPASSPPKRRFTLEVLNSIKIGLIYGLFIEAFKIGS
jgi:predicted MFS family arabinose efflux permease